MGSYQWIVTLPIEVQACSFFLNYWFQDVNPWFFIILITTILLALNIFTVKSYGEVLRLND
jgi:amino acid permease